MNHLLPFQIRKDKWSEPSQSRKILKKKKKFQRIQKLLQQFNLNIKKKLCHQRQPWLKILIKLKKLKKSSTKVMTFSKSSINSQAKMKFRPQIHWNNLMLLVLLEHKRLLKKMTMTFLQQNRKNRKWLIILLM